MSRFHWKAGTVAEPKTASYIIMSPPDILFFPVRLSVRLSVRPSVRHKSCPLYNLKTVKDFSMKLGTLVNHEETMCHAQES